MSLFRPWLGILPVDVVKGHLDILPPVGVLALVVVDPLIAESVVKAVRKRVPGLEGVLIVREFVERISLQESPGG